MKQSASEILNSTVTPEKFSEALRLLDGDFLFDSETMISFGEVYCRLYPESVSHSDSQQVITGYKLVRMLMTEVLLKGVAPDLKSRYREILTSASGVANFMPDILSLAGREYALDIYLRLDDEVKNIKAMIDILPNGVIKERFTGGISVYYNILYLMKKFLNTDMN